ncbi:RING-H2 finger protein ATL16-like isoform X3 [Salvia splendens]|uniref:RING-H2 finger protein ATL16-like isoform X2 n=1 Tax=Salvia splendens TaxID=180675 RepID=UPI001C25B8C8|nr:RING-H2 finger protein ATL16-like isoform X2 [Salvia splendens]XP_042066114.1 RING-H2 finger protein ATL16-like isoform X3 [Salvia splendens]
MDLSPTKSPPPPLSHSHTSFPIIAVAVIGILATAILLVSYYIFVIKCCLTWHRIDLLHRFSFSRRRPPSQDHPHSSPADTRGLDHAAIRSIPIFKFIQTHAKSSDCAVCLNEFQQGEKLRQIPNCCHVFHIDCIDIWLQNNANCPLCRISISARPEILLPIGPDPGIQQDELAPPRKKVQKKSHVSSMGDECIDSRRGRAVVQPMRRSFSMDSAADSQLYLAVQEIIQRHGHVNNNELNQHEACSSTRLKKSFFSFGQGRCSRTAVQVQPLALDPRA